MLNKLKKTTHKLQKLRRITGVIVILLTSIIAVQESLSPVYAGIEGGA